MTGAITALLFALGAIALARYLAKRDRWGYWDKEHHGTNRPQPGIQVRSLEVPPSPPFD